MTRRYSAFRDPDGKTGVEDMKAHIRTVMAYLPVEHVRAVEALMNTAYATGQEHARAKMRAALGLGEEPK